MIPQKRRPPTPPDKARLLARLLAAASADDAAQVRAALAAGADVNGRDGQGRTPLMRAIVGAPGSDDDPKAMLRAMERLTARNVPATIRLLLERGAQVNATDKQGWTALAYACRAGMLPVCEALLARKANPNTAPVNPLFVAVVNRNLPITEALLKAGADPKRCPNSPLIALVMPPREPEDDEEESVGKLAGGLASALLGGAAGEARDTETIALLDRLLAAGADPNALTTRRGTRDFGISPLMLATRAGSPRLIQRLLAAGARVDLPATGEAAGMTALHMAAAAGRADLVRILLEAGANPNATITEPGLTPLHTAVLGGSYAAVALLIQAGARRDAADAQGQTPLSMAVERKMTGLLRLFDDPKR